MSKEGTQTAVYVAITMVPSEAMVPSPCRVHVALVVAAADAVPVDRHRKPTG